VKLGRFDIPGHYTGDCRDLLRELSDGCIQTCVTSPPYWGLRDYGVDGQLGLETTPDEYVANMVAVFAEVRRVLRDDGTLWLNLGDCYAGSGRGARGGSQKPAGYHEPHRAARAIGRAYVAPPPGFRKKELIGLPWMVAFALRADGWILRMDNIWSKPNPMPESVRDRPTKAHEYVFLMSKSDPYYYDKDAAAVPTTWKGQSRTNKGPVATAMPGAPAHRGLRRLDAQPPLRRNLRSVWTVAAQPYDGAHFATFPPALIEPCILAGSRPGDVVLDPFFGSGTTGMVAEKQGRRWLGFDLNPEYAELQKQRTAQTSLLVPR
jgi:DNA modification methylase